MCKKYILFCLLIFGCAVKSGAQSSYTLQQCIDTALAANIPVKQSGLATETAAVNLKQARMNVLPALNADVNHGLNAGRSIDPFTNTYVNQSVNTATYGIGAGIVLFNGLTLQNRIREQAAAYDASRMEWQQSKDNLVLNVILAYLQVLNNEDQLELAERQAQSSRTTLDRLDILNGQGAIRPSDVTDLKGQLMSDQLAIVDARNGLASSRLMLAQLMNKSYDSAMRLERIPIDNFLSGYDANAGDVYAQALDQFAQIKAVGLRTKSAGYAVRSARGQLYPQLSLNGGLNTTYSSIAQNSAGKIPYGSQLKNNRFSSIGLGLTIPIFNASLARNRVKLAGISFKNAQLEEDRTKLLVRQQIDQAWLNMRQSYDRYNILLQQEAAYNESFKAAVVRFEAGVGTSIDYLTAKDRLDRARTNLVNAKYDFVLRKRILDYYSGKR